MTILRTRLLLSSAAFVLAAPALAADAPLSIRTLAPEKAILVAGIDDLDGTRERFARTPLSAWWQSEAVREASREWREGFERSLEQTTQELGVPRETLAWPSSLGFAAYAQLDEETGMEAPAFFAFVDWAKEAEKFDTLYEAAVKRLEKERTVEFRVEEVKGRRVFVFPVDAAADGDVDGDMDDDFGFEAEPTFETYCVTRDGSRLLIASDVAAIEDLIIAVEGDRTRRIADAEDFKGTMELVGGTPDIFAAMFTAPLQSTAAAFAGPEFALVQPFIAKLFGDIRGYSLGITVDGKEAPIEQSIGIFVPGSKVGLLSLLAPGSVEKAPAVVPGDAIGYNRINVRLSGLMAIIDEVLGGLPEMQADQINQLVEPFAPTLRTAFGAMGPGIHVWDTVQQPITAESQRTMTAIAVTDVKAAESLLQTFGPQVGMAPRDFLGNAIYSGDGAPFAVGFGGSFMFLGPTDAVEQGLRAVGRDDGSALEDEPLFRAAMSGVRGDDLIGYGFSDTIATMRTQSSLLDQFAAMAAEMGLNGGMDGEDPTIGLDAIDFEADLDMETLRRLLDPETAKDFFGPSIWTMRAVEKGYRTDFRLLAPMKTSTRIPAAP